MPEAFQGTAAIYYRAEHYNNRIHRQEVGKRAVLNEEETVPFLLEKTHQTGSGQRFEKMQQSDSIFDVMEQLFHFHTFFTRLQKQWNLFSYCIRQ